jgi:hypothetical protein
MRSLNRPVAVVHLSHPRGERRVPMALPVLNSSKACGGNFLLLFQFYRIESKLIRTRRLLDVLRCFN